MTINLKLNTVNVQHKTEDRVTRLPNEKKPDRYI